MRAWERHSSAAMANSTRPPCERSAVCHTALVVESCPLLLMQVRRAPYGTWERHNNAATANSTRPPCER